jgi:hypothetical protein
MRNWMILAGAAVLMGWTGQKAQAGHRHCHTPRLLQTSYYAGDAYYHRSGCCPRSYVIALYHDVLGRTPCERDIVYWTGYLDRCGGRHKFCDTFLTACQAELAARPVVVPVYRPAPVVVAPPPPAVSVRFHYRGW